MDKILLLIAVLATGCSTVDLSIEQGKLRAVQIGMSLKDVESIMGTDEFYYRGVSYGRPMRVDRFKSKDGKPMAIYYYRSSLKREDGVTTDDEMTAVIFVDGKVDAIVAGDFAKQSVEVRLR